MTQEKRRAAVVCDTCGEIHAVRLGPDGEIRLIGTGNGDGCPCGESDLRIMNNDAIAADDEEMTSS